MVKNPNASHAILVFLIFQELDAPSCGILQTLAELLRHLQITRHRHGQASIISILFSTRGSSGFGHIVVNGSHVSCFCGDSKGGLGNKYIYWGFSQDLSRCPSIGSYQTTSSQFNST
jgi:hypothetical protein